MATSLLTSTSEPSPPPEADLLPAEVRESLLAAFAGQAVGMQVICRLPDLRILFANGMAGARFHRGNGAGVLQLSLLEITGLSAHERLRREILPLVQVRGSWTGECDLRDSWGSEFPVTASFAVRAGRPGESYLCLNAVERSATSQPWLIHFTDRHLLHALLQNAPDAIYFKDTASRFLRIGKYQAEKFGLADPSEAIGKTDFDFFDVKHASEAYGIEQEIIRTGRPVIDVEEMETWEDGRVTWCSTTKLPLQDETGKVIGTFGVSRDITARKLAQQSERLLLDQLQLAQKLESIGRLAAGVAHEINTPTQYINDNTHFLIEAFAKLEAVLKGYGALKAAAAGSADCAAAVRTVSALEQEVELDYLAAEIPRCLQQSLDGLARVTRIVTSLKEFAHPNSPELTPADLNRVIETSLVVSRHEWKYVAEVVTDFCATLPPVPCVMDELSQVMLNLIVNAAHAIGAALKLRGGSLGRITVRTRLEAAWAVVEVEDTGTGIPEAIRDRIFEPFFTTKAVGQGTGQGLAVVHTVVVKHHHGTIELSTEPGRGSKFTLRLPLAAPPPEA